MNFRTNIDSSDVSIYDFDLPKLKGLVNGSDYEIEPAPFTVTWSFELETRDWGVKGMSWIVTDIEGEFDVVYFDEKGDEKDRETVRFEFAGFKESTDMDVEIDHGSICPDSLEINYSDHSLIVT